MLVLFFTMQVKLDLTSLLSNKRGLSHRVRVEKTGRAPEHPTQTVVQRIVKAAEEEVSLSSDSGGSPHRNRAGGELMIQHIPWSSTVYLANPLAAKSQVFAIPGRVSQKRS